MKIKTLFWIFWTLCLAPCLQTFAQQKPPNILFCIADDASYPFMSAYGCSWVKTPAFDKVARNGILFNNAYTPNAKCAPSRSCIVTGRNPWQLEAAGNHWSYFPQKFKTYVEALGERGYFTGFTGKGCAPVVAKTADGKPRSLTGRNYNRYKTTPPSRQISTDDYAKNFEAFIKEKPKDQPFCFWYGGWEPHRGYEYASGIKKGGMKTTDITAVPPFWPDTDSVRTDMLDYAFELQYFDQQLMKILDLLEASGELDNTIVIVTSDNGMPFPRVKGQEYEYSNHLPLAVMWKQGIKNPGRMVDDLVSFIDFAPTFLELAGIKTNAAGMQPVQGKSLTDIFYSSKTGIVNPQRSYVLIGKERHDVGRPGDVGYPIRGMVTREYIYLHNFETGRWPAGNPQTGYTNVDGSPTKTACIEAGKKNETLRYWQWSFGRRGAEELYRLQPDRECLNNLAANPEYAGIASGLKEKLFSELRTQQDPRILGNGALFDNYPYADKTGIHFYERYMQHDSTLRWGWINDSDFDDGH
ncbi:sulfatase family protein [Niabella hirudinis]|uniref:sulfatase family protein n=1 Tax=Niabella hirudinis TaxID=1285929 RepID=UPI003EBAF8BF